MNETTQEILRHEYHFYVNTVCKGFLCCRAEFYIGSIRVGCFLVPRDVTTDQKQSLLTYVYILCMFYVCHFFSGERGKKDRWVKEYQGQLLISTGAIQWTTDCSKALNAISGGNKTALKALKKKQVIPARQNRGMLKVVSEAVVADKLSS